MSSYEEIRDRLRNKYVTGSTDTSANTTTSNGNQNTSGGSYEEIRDTLRNKYSDENVSTMKISVSDWAKRYDKVTREWSNFDSQRNGGYSKDIGGGFGKEIDSLISEYETIKPYADRMGLPNASRYVKILENLLNHIHNGNEYFSQWETEDEYNKWKKGAEEYEALLNHDTVKGEKEIEDLEKLLKEYRGLSRTMIDENMEKRLEYIRQNYGDEQGIKTLIAEKKAYMNRAKHIQEGITLAGVIDNDDFKENSGYVSTKSDGGWKNLTSQYGMGYDDLTYEYINGEESGMRQEIINKAVAYDADTEKFFVYDHMTEDQVSTYNYYYAKDGKEAAEKYLDSIQETLNYQAASERYKKMEGKTALEMLFGIEAGVDQFQSGFKNVFNTEDDYIAQTAIQMASGMVREDLADNGVKLPDWLGGASLGQMGYDTITTSANMAPSILTSVAIGFINPVAGQWFGSAMMGASAAGNAYQEALNEGYSQEQARGYSILVGGSEMVMEKVLGGISAVGGNALGKLFTKNISNADTALKMIAKKLGGSILSEFSEEYLQEVLTPVFQNIAFGTDNEVKLFSPEALYSGILGALTAGIMEGPFAVGTEVKTHKTGKQLQAAGISATRLAEIGSTFSADTVAYQLAGKVDENTGAYTMGRLFNEIGATLSEQNVTEITEALIKEGIPEKLAKKKAKTMALIVDGATLTDEFIEAMDDDKILAKAVKATIIDPNATWFQRSKGYNEALMALAQEKTSQAKATKQSQENALATNTVGTQNNGAVQSLSEAETVDTSPAKVKTISSINNGQVTVKLEDGTEVNLKQADLSVDDGVRIDTIAKLDGISAADANFILNTLRTNTSTSAQMDSLGAREAYKYGYYGFSKEHMATHGVFANSLTDTQRQAIYQTGQNARAVQVAAQQAAVAKNATTSTKVTGKVHFEGDRSTLTERQNTSLTALERVADALGVQIYVFESKVNERGKRIGANGWYDPKDSSIHIDLHAGSNGAGTMLFTLAHELTHHIRKWSPAKFKVLADFLMQEYGKKGVNVDALVREQMAKAKRNGRTISYDTAYEEVVADSMEMMLADGKVMEKLAKLKAQDKSLWQKIKDFISELAVKIRAAYEGMSPDSVEGRHVSEMVDAIERLQDLFTEGLVEASEYYQSSLTPGEEGVVVSENGDPVAYSTEDGSVLLSMRTYDEEGRKAFRDYLNKCVSSNKLTKEEMQEMMDGIEDIYQTCKEFKDKYAPFSSWSDAAVVRDTYGKPVFSVVTPNGDYKMNLDFSLVCKKRRTLDAVFNEMSRRGIIDDFELGQKSVVKINEIIRKNGLETACALCFVDAKRFRQASMADSFTNLYNELVLSLVPEDQRSSIDHFNFSGYETIKKVEDGIHKWDASKLDFSHLDEVMKDYGKGTVEHKAAKYIKSHAEGRRLLLRGDFMSSQGFDAVKTQNKDVLKLYNSKKGTGGPKAAFGDVQYMNDIIKKARTWTPAKAYAVGGVRIQSFSDYVPRMVFDYVQMIYDLAATKLPAHAYTKEALFVKQFGLTGVKINMSLIPAIAEGGIAPGLDANGNYVWAGESFDYETAKEIQNAEGYTENCGTICVGVSDRHIRKLLSDPNIRMVIPYHKSGLNPIVAHMNKIAEFTDYTNDQRTKGKDGKALDNDFDFSKALHDMGENASPKAVADQYLKWCAANGYTARFAEFAVEDNYYKLLEDFTLYDKDGKYVPQREVRAVFPKEGSAFGSMKDLIKAGLEEDAIVEGKRDSRLSKIVDEIQNTLPRTEAEIEETQVEQADRDLEEIKRSDRDSDGNQLSKRQQDFFRSSKVRDADGNLMVMYHGTANGGSFTVFDGDKLGNDTRTTQVGQGFYFTNMKAEAEAYTKNVDVYGRTSAGRNPHLHQVYLNITNPFNIDSDTLDIDKVKSVYMDGTYDYFFSNWIPFYLKNKTLDGRTFTKAEVEAMSKTDKVSVYVDYLVQLGTKEVLSNMVRAFPYGKQSELLTTMKKRLGYDGIVEEFKPGQYQYVAFSADQIKATGNQNPTSDPDIRYSDRDYSYDTLVSKPDMVVTEVVGNVPKNRADIIAMAKKNATSVGRFDPKTGSISVHVKDIGTDVVLGTTGLKHGLEGRRTDNAIVTLKAGEILQNSIRINELTPKKKEADGSYVLIGAARGSNGDLYIVRSVVNTFKHELLSMDVLYAINAKKGNRLRSMRPGFQGPVTDSTISIAELLDRVNQYFPDVLPEEVLKHYGYDARPEGKLGEDALYSDRDSDGNQLSEDQLEYFEKSMARDRDGRLQVVYHGGTVKFEFDTSRGAAGKTEYGPGGYFTESEFIAKQYSWARGGNVKEYYLNIERMFDDTDMARTVQMPQWQKLEQILKRNGIEEKYIQQFREYGFGYMRRYLAIKAGDRRSDNWSGSEQMNAMLREAGFDGVKGPINDSIQYVIFTPNQAKLTTNEVPSGFYDTRYSDRDVDSVSNRSLLANAFEGVAQNDIERQKIQEYKGKISLIEAEERKLQDLNQQIKDLSFAKGPKDTKAIRDLQFEAKQTANRISTFDKQLLRLEASKPLQDVLQREKKMAYQRAEKKGKEALEAYREKALKTQRELNEKWQESRKKGIESRQRTAMRHKIKDVVNELNQYLLRGTKDRHVPIELQKAVAEALDAVNMDTVGADERIAKLEAELLKAKTPEKIQEISRKIDHILEMGDRMNNRLKKLKDAYDQFVNSDDPMIANSHDEVISNKLQSVIESVGDTPLRDMSIAQLEDVYDMYRMVLTTIRNTNKAFKAKKSESISVIAGQVMMEVEKVGGKKKLSLKGTEGIKGFFWNNLKPVYAFEHIGSDHFTEVFNNVRAGEDVWALDVTEAREFYLDKSKKHGYDSWDFKKRYKFTSTSGMDFELDLEQIMSLYAYSKREQAADHLKRGGIVIDETTEITVKNKLGIPVKFNPTEATAYNISDATLAEIISKLTADQKDFVDVMQDYLSTVMGAKGNEVSLEMYGVKLFKEKFYFPLKSAQQFMAKAKEQQKGEVKIKNSGFSKETVQKASNPIVLTPFMNVWADHVNEMSMYHAFVLPMEDFYRVYNYKTPTSDTMATESVEMFIQNAYGKGATQYIDQLLKDLNGGARTDHTTGIINKMMGLFKKGAVFASLSVVVQQPSAIARAAALVDTKYFIGPKVDHKRHKALWDEVKQYAPVAVIKEMGYFDTNMGKSTQDFILGKEYSGFKDKMKALFTDSGYRDEALSKAPALADEIAWCSIWEAVKRETKANYPGLDAKAEPFLMLCGSRFTEVIVKTQVYDSVLSRSGLMRSKDTGMKMATSFMAEPTTSINMIADALLKGKRGNRKYARGAIGAVIASQILNSILVSFVYAGRDDDEDETYAEKYIGTLSGEILDSLNPAGYIPFIKDIQSIVQGYDVERSDMAVISDLWKAWENLSKDYISPYRKVEGFAGSIAQIFGLPVKNIMRDARGIYQTIDSFVNGQQTTKAGIGYAVKGAITGKTVSNDQQLYEAILSGDQTQIARVKGRFEDQSSINSAIRKALRENDPRIQEAAVAWNANDLDEYMRIAKQIIGEKHFSQDDVVMAIRAEANKLMPDTGTSGTSKAKGLFTAEKFAEAIAQGDQATANAIRMDIIQTAQNNGKTAGEATKSFESTAKGDLKELFLAGTLNESRAIHALTTFCGESQEEAEQRVSEWRFENQHGFKYDDKKQKFMEGEISASELKNLFITVEGKTDEEANSNIVSYTRDAYEEGFFDRDSAASIMIDYGGLTEGEAESKLQYIDVKKQLPDTYVDDAWVAEYYKEVESSGISIEVFVDYRNQVKGITGEGKKERRMAVINSMPISNAQKDALYYAEGWAASRLYEAPWR